MNRRISRYTGSGMSGRTIRYWHLTNKPTKLGDDFLLLPLHVQYSSSMRREKKRRKKRRIRNTICWDVTQCGNDHFFLLLPAPVHPYIPLRPPCPSLPPWLEKKNEEKHTITCSSHFITYSGETAAGFSILLPLLLLL